MTGVATSVSFDLYGCIQVVINPGIDKDGKYKDMHWLDYNRIEILSKKRVMDIPQFLLEEKVKSASNEIPGPENKPKPRQ